MSTPIPVNHATFTVWEVAAVTGGRVVGVHDRDLRAASITTDSRAAGPGVAFVALVGERLDAHRFVAATWTAGSPFAIVAEPQGEGPQVVVDDTLVALGALARAHLRRWRKATPRAVTAAVTGSAGKTTTKEILAVLLGARLSTWKTPGNLNNRIGLPMVALATAASHEAVVLEAGMSLRGEIAALTAIAEPDVAVISSIGLAHAEGVGGALSDVAREKGDIVRGLNESGVAVLHAEDPVALAQALGARCRRVVTFGRGEGADVRLVSRRIDGLEAATLRVRRAGVDAAPFEVLVPFPGEAQALDFCAALAAADVLLASPLRAAEVAEAMSRLAPLEGRGRVVLGQGGVTLIDDCYNANPESVLRALELTRELADQRKLRANVVLGAMRELGVASAAAHARVLDRALELGFTRVVGAGAEMDAAMKAHPSAERFMPCGGVDAATAHLQGCLSAEDLLLVKGSRSVGLERLLEALAGATPPMETT
jgi:UDP-N-acetylmuramoyl-tripeptide--D-alanyl-D-alanine ligase